MELRQLCRAAPRTEKRKKNPAAGLARPMSRRSLTKTQFCRMVERAKRHIREGDIFQIVLSNRLRRPFKGSLLNTYRVLRTINPSPYMFYFSGTDVEVAGASPETLVKLENGVLHTFPLAGTRPRGKTEDEDRALEAELLVGRKGTCRAQHAGRSGPQRPRENQQIRYRTGGKAALRRTFFPCHAHRLYGAGRNPGGLRRARRHRGGSSGGDAFRRPENSGPAS